MSFTMLAKAVNTTTVALKTAGVAIEKFSSQKVKYQAYLDNISKLVSVTGTGAGYINQLSWLIDMQNKAAKKSDFYAVIEWQRKIDVALDQMSKWLLANGMPFNINDFRNFKKAGGNPETQGVQVQGAGPTSGSGLTTGTIFGAGTSNGTLP